VRGLGTDGVMVWRIAVNENISSEDRMTPTQRDIYNVIHDFWKDYGYGPSIDDILLISNRKGRGNIQRIISRLVQEGHCVRLPHQPRTVRPKGLRIYA
jgi:SOS-response transcriptional repressor LexA